MFFPTSLKRQNEVEDYSDDESHPNEWGHKMTADLIMNMFDKVTEKIKTMGDVTISPLPDTWYIPTDC